MTRNIGFDKTFNPIQNISNYVFVVFKLVAI
jgi:hypothetical protein